MNKIYLKVDNVTYELENEIQVFEKILHIYIYECEVVLGELLACTYISGLNLDQIEDLIKRLREEIDGEQIDKGK